MIQLRHPLPIARPYSVQRSDDARARRARLLRRARVLRSVWAGIQRYEAEQVDPLAAFARVRQSEGAELSACGFCACPFHPDCERCFA